MLASTKSGSAAAREQEGDGEDSCGDAIGSPLPLQLARGATPPFFYGIVLKSSAARGLVRTTIQKRVRAAARHLAREMARSATPRRCCVIRSEPAPGRRRCHPAAETGRLVTVFLNPATGERRYVAADERRAGIQG